MDGIGNNIVLFRVGSLGKGPTPVSYGAVLKLCVDGAWKLGCGVEPTVNSARVPWTEYDRLNGETGPITGQVEFWWTKMPGVGVEPDHVLNNVTLVEVEASEFGAVDAAGPRRAVEYRLYFADSRHWWLPPRGGHLSMQGIINAPGDQYLAANSTLLATLLQALGVSENKIIIDQEAVDELPVMRNLEWRAAHPQVELKKLLDELGLVLAPQADGVSFRVDVAGVGPVPTVPDERDLGTVPLPGIDRRGKCVVFTSAPIAQITTETLQGPDPTTFEFVGQSDNGETSELVWRPLRLIGSWGIEDFRDNYARYGENVRSRLVGQAYRFVRFNPLKGYDLHRLVFENGEVRGGAIIVRAKIAQYDDVGVVRNSDEFVEIPATCMFKAQCRDTKDSRGNIVDGYIIGVTPNLIRVQDDDGKGILDPIANAVELQFGEMEIRISYESLVHTTGSNVPLEDVNGKLTTQYFRSGYMLESGDIRKLSDAELANALLDPDTITIRDERVLVVGGNGPSTRNTLEGEREALAWRWLRGSGDKPTRRSIIGFFPVELSGVVAEIKWSQADKRTDLETNNWYLPTGLWSIGRMQEERKTLAEKFPGQAATAQTRATIGGTTASQPSVLLTPMANGVAPADSSFWARLSAVEERSYSHMDRAQPARYKFVRQQQVDNRLVDVAGALEQSWARHPSDPDGSTLIVGQRVLLRPGKKDDNGDRVFWIVAPDGPQLFWARIAAPYSAATWDSQGYSFQCVVRDGKRFLDKPGAGIETGLRHPSECRRLLRDTIVMVQDLGVDPDGVRLVEIVDTIEQAVLVRVNGNEIGGGKYAGSILGKISGTRTLGGQYSLAANDLGDVEGGAEDCLLFAAVEVGADGTASRTLSKGAVVEGIIQGWASDGRRVVVTAGSSGVYPISDYLGTVYQTKALHVPDQDFGTSFDDTTKILSLWWAGVSVKNCGADTLYMFGKHDAPLVLGPGLIFTNSTKKLEVSIGSTLPCLSFVADGCSLKLDAGDYDCISETFIKSGSLSFDGKYLCYTPVTITFIGKTVEGSQVCVTLCP